MEGDGAEAGEAYRSGTKSEHYWALWTSAYDGKPPSTYLLSCTPYGLTALHILQHPQLLLATIQLLLEFLVSPLLEWEVLLGSIWVPKEENLRQRSLYCPWVLSEILMEKQGPP